MQSYTVVWLLVASVFGHVNCRATAGVSVISVPDNEVGLPLECPYKAVPDTIQTVMFQMLNKTYECYKPSTTFINQINSAPDTAAFRRLFQTACIQEPAVRSCVADVALNVDVCLSEGERKLWDTVMDFFDTSITATCADGSDTIAAMYGDELKVMTVGNQLRLVSCFFSAMAETHFNREADLPAYTVRKYNAMKSGRQCIINVAKRGQTSSNNFELFMGELIRSMKCLSPANEIVPCDTLDAVDSQWRTAYF